MSPITSIGEPWMWAVFIAFVLIMLMLIAPWYHVPVQASLAIVAILIGSSVIASLIATRRAN